MPRRARLEVTDAPQLILQRGTGGSPLFRRTVDYERYLEDLHTSSRRYDCAVHAYALLRNQVELLITGSEPGAVSRMMQSLSRRYARYANERDAIQGARWLGRYHSCPVGGNAHVLRAYAHVELSPSRVAGLEDAGAYRWSSQPCNAYGAPDPCITPHQAYMDLSGRPGTRRARYRALVAGSVPEDAQEILMHIHQGCALGEPRFLKLMAKLGVCRLARPRGRPRKVRSVIRTHAWATLSPFLLTGSIEMFQTVTAAL